MTTKSIRLNIFINTQFILAGEKIPEIFIIYNKSLNLILLSTLVY